MMIWLQTKQNYNLHYINIVENTSNQNNPNEDNTTVKISLNNVKIKVVL